MSGTTNSIDPLKVPVEQVIKENAKEAVSNVPVEGFVKLQRPVVPAEEPKKRPFFFAEIKLPTV